MKDARRNGSGAMRWCLSFLAAVAAGVLVLLYVILPMNRQRTKIEAELEKRLRATDQALESVRKLSETRQQHALGMEALGMETNLYVLRPVLGSFPVQRDIYRLAAETGFNLSLVREIGKTPTPVITAARRGRTPSRKPAPTKSGQADASSYFTRYVVDVSGEGSYASVLALIERLEQENPYCGVTALTIRGLPNAIARHRVSLTLEWPVAADPPVAKAAGSAR